MRVTEYRTMLYLPRSLYLKSVRAAKGNKKSLAAYTRDALEAYLDHPEKKDFKLAIDAAFGIWKEQGDTVAYVQELRRQWSKRARRLRL